MLLVLVAALLPIQLNLLLKTLKIVEIDS